eukprot:2686531-Rhodomonas_salina.1
MNLVNDCTGSVAGTANSIAVSFPVVGMTLPCEVTWEHVRVPFVCVLIASKPISAGAEILRKYGENHRR